jgi:hypothetical protein
MQKTWKPTAAGVLAIIGGALNILVALSISLFVPVAAPFRYAVMSAGFVAVLFLGTGIIALIGGIFALQRRHWGLSLAGAICAMMPPASLLGIVSTVFVALSREEFSTTTANPVRRESGLLPMESSAEANSECNPCDAAVSQPSEGERNA